jgi:hypothetical protein
VRGVGNWLGGVALSVMWLSGRTDEPWAMLAVASGLLVAALFKSNEETASAEADRARAEEASRDWARLLHEAEYQLAGKQFARLVKTRRQGGGFGQEVEW